MARSYTFSPLILILSISLMAGVVHAQANRPLEVNANNPNNASSNDSSQAGTQAASQAEMVRRARDLAQKADAAQRRAATPVTQSTPTTPAPFPAPAQAAGSSSELSPLPPLAKPAAATTSTAAASGTASAETATAPPVVPVDPNESKPLGPSGQNPGGKNDLQATSSAWGMTKTILALAFVVLLILVGRQLMLRWMGRPAAVNRSRAVEVLSRISVGPRQHVVLLRMGGRILVVADSAGQMRPLANIDEPEEVASILKSVTTSRPSSISQGFGQMLGKFDQEYDQDDDKLRISDEGQDTAEFQVDKTRDQINGLLARVKAMAGKGGA